MLHFIRNIQAVLAAVAITATAVAGDNEPEEETLPQGVSSSWWSEVQRSISAEEYHATMQPDGLQAPNRAHNLRTWFDSSGAVRKPRNANGEDSGEWQWGLALDRFGWTDGSLAKVSPAEPTPNEITVTYDRGSGLTEWYVNDEKGLRSWYKLENAPRGSGDWLRLELAVRGNTTAVARGDGSLAFVTPDGVEVINYGGLKAWDAWGKELRCRLKLLDADAEGHAFRVALDVEATGAEFPVTIDPLATSPAWTAESDQAYAHFGNSVSDAGDVNGDGY